MPTNDFNTFWFVHWDTRESRSEPETQEGNHRTLKQAELKRHGGKDSVKKKKIGMNKSRILLSYFLFYSFFLIIFTLLLEKL